MTMPAGVSWPRYLRVMTAAMLSMFAGSQTVHVFYYPLQDLEAKVELEKEHLRKASKNEEGVKAVPS